MPRLVRCRGLAGPGEPSAESDADSCGGRWQEPPPAPRRAASSAWCLCRLCPVLLLCVCTLHFRDGAAVAGGQASAEEAAAATDDDEALTYTAYYVARRGPEPGGMPRGGRFEVAEGSFEAFSGRLLRTRMMTKLHARKIEAVKVSPDWRYVMFVAALASDLGNLYAVGTQDAEQDRASAILDEAGARSLWLTDRSARARTTLVRGGSPPAHGARQPPQRGLRMGVDQSPRLRAAAPPAPRTPSSLGSRTSAPSVQLAPRSKPGERTEWAELAGGIQERLRPLCGCVRGRELDNGTVLQATLADSEGGLPCLAVGSDGLVASTSRAFQDLVGHGQDDLLGRRPADITLLCPAPPWLHEVLNGQSWGHVAAFYRGVALAQKAERCLAMLASPPAPVPRALPSRRSSVPASRAGGDMQRSRTGLAAAAEEKKGRYDSTATSQREDCSTSEDEGWPLSEEDRGAPVEPAVTAKPPAEDLCAPRAVLLVGATASGEAAWQLTFTFRAQLGTRHFAVHVPVLLAPQVPGLLWPCPGAPLASELLVDHAVVQAALGRLRSSIGSWGGGEGAEDLVEAASAACSALGEALAPGSACEGHHFVPRLGSACRVPLDSLRAWQQGFAGMEAAVTAGWARPDPSLLPHGAARGQPAAAGLHGAACWVSDPSEPDCPLVYVSRGFEDLTGYWQAFALGRNVRFVQPKDRGRNRRYNGPELARIRRFCEHGRDDDQAKFVTVLLCESATGQLVWTMLYMQCVAEPGEGGHKPYVFGLLIPLWLQTEVIDKVLGREWTDQNATSLADLRARLLEQYASFDHAKEALHSLADRVLQQWVFRHGGAAPPVGISAARRFARRCSGGAAGLVSREPRWVRGASVAFAIVDPEALDCPLVHAGPGLTELTGYSADELLSRNVRVLQPSSPAISRAANGDQPSRLDDFCLRSRADRGPQEAPGGRATGLGGMATGLSRGPSRSPSRGPSRGPSPGRARGPSPGPSPGASPARSKSSPPQWTTGPPPPPRWAAGGAGRTTLLGDAGTQGQKPAASQLGLFLAERPTGERYWVLLRAECVHFEDEANDGQEAGVPLHGDAARSNSKEARVGQPRPVCEGALDDSALVGPQTLPYVRLDFIRLNLRLPAALWHRQVTDFEEQLPDWSTFLESLREGLDSENFGHAHEARLDIEARYSDFLRQREDYRGDHFVPRIGLRFARQFEQLGGWRAVASGSPGLLDPSAWGDHQAHCACDPAGEDGPLVHVSPGFEELTGYSREQSLGRNCRFLQPHEQVLSAALNGEERSELRSFCSAGIGGAGPALPWILRLVVNERRSGECFLNLLLVQRAVVDGRAYLVALLTPLERDLQRLVETLAMDEDGLRQLRRLRTILRRREGSCRSCGLDGMLAQAMAEWVAEFPPFLELPAMVVPDLDRRVPLVGVEVCTATAGIETVVGALESGLRHFHITFREHRVDDSRLNVSEVHRVSLRLAEMLNLLRQLRRLYYLREGIVFTVCSPPHLIDAFSEVQKAFVSNGYEISGWLLDARASKPEAVRECWARMSAAKRRGEVAALGLLGGGQRAVEAAARAPNASRVALYAMDAHPARRLENAEAQLLQRLHAEGTALLACNVSGPGQCWRRCPEAQRAAADAGVTPEVLAVKWCEHQGWGAIVSSDRFVLGPNSGAMHRAFVREYRTAPPAHVCYAAWDRGRPSATRSTTGLPSGGGAGSAGSTRRGSLESPAWGRRAPEPLAAGSGPLSDSERKQSLDSQTSQPPGTAPLLLGPRALATIRRPVGRPRLPRCAGVEAPVHAEGPCGGADLGHGTPCSLRLPQSRGQPSLRPPQSAPSAEWPRVGAHLGLEPRFPKLLCASPAREGHVVDKELVDLLAQGQPGRCELARQVTPRQGAGRGGHRSAGLGETSRSANTSQAWSTRSQALTTRQSEEGLPRWSPRAVKSRPPPPRRARQESASARAQHVARQPQGCPPHAGPSTARS
ncbi:unnamed protein product [Prorocentrum cordatum]|uniref:PAS domain-containing protein n=1 Tax=Prorocentrum cordatum TaxID=2364126 RepID=A0ABN9UQL0_9DINO|nr:unnamed protein product [Polarella glacialis]